MHHSKILSCRISFVLSFLFFFTFSIPAFAEPSTKTIGISQIVEHPALDAVRQSLIETLKTQGFEEGKNLNVIYENAQGNMVTSVQIANKLMSRNLDVAVGISTPSAQTLYFEAQKHKKKIPIVFSAVSDPNAAQLESNTGYPITGITDTANLEGLLELMHSLMPNLKKLGLMYNPSESNSASTINRLKKLLDKQGIEYVEVTVTKTQEVAQATKSFIGKVDALYFPQDNTIVSAIQTVVNIASQSSPKLPIILPIFTSDPILLKSGVLAAVGYDYEDVGSETGMMVSEILKGKDPKTLLVHSPKKLKAVVNADFAEKLGLTIPKKLEFSEIHTFSFK